MVDERLLQAEEQVEAFIQILSKRYGICEDEIPQLVEGIRWAVEQRNNVRKLSWHALLGIISAVMAGFALILWEGLKALLENK